MNRSTHTNGDPSKESIARFAYMLWEKEGCPAGRDQEHWFRAEAQLRALQTEKPAVRKRSARAISSGSAKALQ